MYVDTHKYDLKTNKDLISWLIKSLENGYNFNLSIEELQDLIDELVIWYEIKYPNTGIDNDFIETLNMEKLLKHLPYKEASLLECRYRSRSVFPKLVYNDDYEIEYTPHLMMNIKTKENTDEDTTYIIYVDSLTGYVAKEDDKYFKKDLKLEKLLFTLREKYHDKLEFSDIEECVYNHYCDFELRKMILEYAALKLLFSVNSNLENGYMRAKKLIEDFNEEFDAHLSLFEIESIMGEEHSYLTFPEKDSRVRSIFKKFKKD